MLVRRYIEILVSIPYSSGLGFEFLGLYEAVIVPFSVSIPYSSGLGFEFLQSDREKIDALQFQSPIHRVWVLNLAIPTATGPGVISFNPLFIGSGF